MLHAAKFRTLIYLVSKPTFAQHRVFIVMLQNRSLIISYPLIHFYHFTCGMEVLQHSCLINILSNNKFPRSLPDIVLHYSFLNVIHHCFWSALNLIF